MEATHAIDDHGSPPERAPRLQVSGLLRRHRQSDDLLLLKIRDHRGGFARLLAGELQPEQIPAAANDRSVVARQERGHVRYLGIRLEADEQHRFAGRRQRARRRSRRGRALHRRRRRRRRRGFLAGSC